MNRTVERTLAILELIANSENGITLQEIAQAMDWQKAALLSLFIRCLNFNTSKLWKTTTKNTASTYEHFPLA